MGFAFYYRSTRPVTPTEAANIERAADELTRGHTWLSCEPVSFYAARDDGLLVGACKPNFQPDPEDAAAAAEEDLPDGTTRDLIEILRQLSELHAIDWEISHDHSNGPIGYIRGGVCDSEVIKQSEAFADLARMFENMWNEFEPPTNVRRSSPPPRNVNPDDDEDGPPILKFKPKGNDSSPQLTYHHTQRTIVVRQGVSLLINTQGETMREPLAWVTEGDKTDTILAIGKESIFLAVGLKGNLFDAQDMVRSGSDPKRVLPRDYTEFTRESLLEIRHQRDSKAIAILYTDRDKTRTCKHRFEDAKKATEGVQAIAKAMSLSGPREELATVAAITWPPLLAASLPLLLFGLTYFAAIGGNNPDPNRKRVKVIEVLMRTLASGVGPNGLLLIMAAIVLAAFAYWYRNFVNRPIVDIYTVAISTTATNRQP